MPNAVLTGLKKYPVRLSVICAMLDDGGSAGKERRDYNTAVSFGDIRRASYALADTDLKTKDFYNSRYKDGEFKGHVVSNITTTIEVSATGDIELAINKLNNEIFKIPKKHQVLPATLDNSTLCAKLENGKKIKGETNIDIPKHNGNLKIKKVFLEPEARAYPKALEAIKKADLILIGPGDLYSSLSQIFLVKDVAGTVNKNRAKKVYICNLMTKNGETNNFTVSDFAAEVEKFLDGKLDYVIYNNALPEPERIDSYKREHPELLDLVSFDGDLTRFKKFIGENLLPASGPIIHDSAKLARKILSLCRQ